MGQKMGLRSVTTVQGVSVTHHSSFFLDWAMHTTGGMGESVIASTKLLNIWQIVKPRDAHLL